MPCGRQSRHLAERAPARDEQVGLAREVGAAGLDERHHRQPVALGDLEAAQLLGHPDRRDRAALHRRLVGDDQALDAADRPDPDDEPGARGGQVGLVRAGERADLEERGVGVEEQVDALARREPAALVVAVDVLRPAGGEHRRGHLVDARERGQHRLAVRRELRRRRVEARAEHGARRDLGSAHARTGSFPGVPANAWPISIHSRAASPVTTRPVSSTWRRRISTRQNSSASPVMASPRE